MNSKVSILVVEHDPLLSMLLLEILSEAGYVTELWTEQAGVLEFVRQTQPDLVILDLWLRQRGDGWQVFDRLQYDPATRRIPIILCTDDTLLLRPEEAQLISRAAAVLEKPFELDRLLELITEVLRVDVTKPDLVLPHVESPILLLDDTFHRQPDGVQS